jgi:hypothetical protein
VRHCCIALMLVANFASSASAQVQDAGSSEIRKQWFLGEHSARDLDQRFDRVDDVSLLNYLQSVETRITSAVGAKPVEIRVTRSSEQSATPLPNGVLYLSTGMLARVKSESELAGLLAHELAHLQQPGLTPSSGGIEILSTCVLGSTLAPTRSVSQLHDEELRATAEAVRYAKLADYDPLSGLELLSKLAYENPIWGKTIRSEDLLDLRATLEPEAPPASGYILDTSDFITQHARIVASLSQIRSRPSPASLRSLRKP